MKNICSLLCYIFVIDKKMAEIENLPTGDRKRYVRCKNKRQNQMHRHKRTTKLWNV